MTQYTSEQIQQILAEQHKQTAHLRKGGDAYVNHIHASEGKRKVPLEDYESIMLEYWDRQEIRPLHFTSIIADRYNVKLGVIEKIVMNFYNTLDSAQYSALVETYTQRFPDWRNQISHMVYATGVKDTQSIGKKISDTKNTLSAQCALEIYERCLAEDRSKKLYAQLAVQYGVSASKIMITANGHHPALAHRNAEQDYADWKRKRYGDVVLISPDGVEIMFTNLIELGEFMYIHEGRAEHSHNPTKCWQYARSKIENIPLPGSKQMRRRHWKQWVFQRVLAEI